MCSSSLCVVLTKEVWCVTRDCLGVLTVCIHSGSLLVSVETTQEREVGRVVVVVGVEWWCAMTAVGIQRVVVVLARVVQLLVPAGSSFPGRFLTRSLTALRAITIQSFPAEGMLLRVCRCRLSLAKLQVKDGIRRRPVPLPVHPDADAEADDIDEDDFETAFSYCLIKVRYTTPHKPLCTRPEATRPLLVAQRRGTSLKTPLVDMNQTRYWNRSSLSPST